jgi:signal transduction histidine kinase
LRFPLRRLRLRLTAWYFVTFLAVLLVSRVVLSGLLVRASSRELDVALRDAVREVIRATAIRLDDGAEPRRAAVESADELESPLRPVYLFDAAGEPLFPAGPEPPVLRALAKRTLAAGSAEEEFDGSAGQRWRVIGQRMEVRGGGAYAVLALADLAEVEREDERVSRAFLLTSLLALLLVAAGGWYLASISVVPVERMMEQMRRFMADAAHELRTPVSVLRSRAELTLERERDAAAYEAALQEIAREAARMGGVVDDLFTLARADAGAPTVARTPLYLDDLVSDAVEAASTLAEAKGVRIELGRYEEAPVVGDPALLRQLVMILLDNAVKYTPPGGRVEAAVYRQGGTVTVVVDDTGMGIEPEELSRLFERFYRSERAREQGGGAGLGLSIARWIADSHGARLLLAPRAGGGTRAELRIPARLSSS